MDKELLLKYAREIIKIDMDHIHGKSHWERVERYGYYLAGCNGADKKVLSLFAYTHDLGRENDSYEDFFHGRRSAQIVKDFFAKGILDVTSDQLEKLIYACAHHTELYAQSDDLTIKTCWDCDRLDVWRVGLEPNPAYLYTPEAKNPDVIISAKYCVEGESRKGLF